MPALLTSTPQGLYCPAGDFHVDPWEPVERAVVTHAHADHLTPGCGSYITSRRGEPVVRQRLPADANVCTLDWGEPLDLRGVRLTLHPAGHILGSAQVRLRHTDETWVFTGDFKLAPDPTCEPAEPLGCDVLVTESTFGLPIYRWPDEREVWAELNDWWRINRDTNRTSVLLAYALGKAQRVLAGLDASIGPIVVHGSVHRFADVYRHAGITLPPTQTAAGEMTREQARVLRGRAIVVAPPSVLTTPWLRKFAPYSSAMASGWMRVRGRRRRLSLDRGFVLSDHADWPALLTNIEQSGARRIGLTHGRTAAFAEFLRERGYDTFTLPTRFESELDSGSDSGSER